MKKVGIMSMQRVTNYGSFLQAYGLMKTIKKIGYEVEFVDYKYEKTIVDNKKKNLFKRILDNINLVNFFKRKNTQKSFKESYKFFLKKYLNIRDERNYYPNIETLVIGSDEVFNCLQTFPVGYSRNLYGKGYEKNNVISYAASFGHTTLKGLKEHKIDDEITSMLKKFKSISVRDENSKEIIYNLTNINPEIHLDPVLISDFNDEINNIKIKINNYIVVYAYSGRLSKREEKYIKKFAKKNNKKIISLGFYQKIADYNLVVDPFEVLAYIKNADFVITDTFHGSVFSIKMNTKFCTLVRKSNYNKLTHLLDKLGHSSQIIKKIEDIETKYIKDIDFKESNTILELEKNKAINYLKKNI